MADSRSNITRRAFVKALGLAAAVPVLPAVLKAQETTRTTPTSAPSNYDVHRVVTANILATLSEHDNTPVDWETRRKDVCFQVLKDQQAHIICLQEVLRSQWEDFRTGFPEFQTFGFPGPYMDTNPKRFQGIKNVIMFSRSRYQLTSAGSYPLSETPLIEGSKSWDPGLGRHVNWVRLMDRKTGSEFRVLNTHLSVRHPEARQQSVKIINAESGQYQEIFPQIIAGDFNANVTLPSIQAMKSGGWTDTWEAVHGDVDPGNTGHGFTRTGPDLEVPDSQIDFIFCRGNIKPVAAKVIRDKVNGQLPSDHFFVSADLVLGVS